MASADPEIRTLVAEEAANAAISRLDADGRRARTASASKANWQRYLDAVDPDGTMSPEDRERAAEHARRADMARLSRIAVQARREHAALAAAGQKAS